MVPVKLEQYDKFFFRFGLPYTFRRKNIKKLEILLADYFFEVKKNRMVQKDYYLKRLDLLGTVKSIKKLKGLPMRGQRTHTNARTRKRFKIV